MQGYFPAALAAFEDLDACDTLALLGKAADPDAAARLTLGQISAALRRARRRDVATKAAAIQAALRSPQLRQPAQVTAAYASSVRALVARLGTLNEQVDALHEQVKGPFWPAPGR